MDAMLSREDGSKAVVFSQFSGTLDRVEEALGDRLGLDAQSTTVRLDTLAPKERPAALARFVNDPEACALLLTLRMGAAGLNLTAANHVFLCEVRTSARRVGTPRPP